MKKNTFNPVRFLVFFADVFYMSAICLFCHNFVCRADVIVAPAELYEGISSLYVDITYVCVAAFCLLCSGTYNRMLRYSTMNDILRMSIALITAFLLSVIGSAFKNKDLILYCFLCYLFFVLAIIFSRMVYYYVLTRVRRIYSRQEHNPILIVGAGTAGVMLLKELRQKPKMGYPVYLCDDDNKKIGMYIEGSKVLAPTILIPDVCEKYHIKTIFIAIPSASKSKLESIKNLCMKTKCEIHILPFLSSLIGDKPFLQQSRVISYSDMLGRDEVLLEKSNIINLINNKVVLVTGGGGSIGSELCRQIAELGPKKLIVFDIYENNAYDIQQDLLMKNPSLDLSVEIASVRDAKKVDYIFDKYRPQVVFHAAAHKHVPLMEFDPEEAVKNNIGGTYNVALTAAKYRVQKFVLISTDKAVNPTNVMGATKRFCEMIVQYINATTLETSFSMVRFGNVLGSNGSVVPLFKKQIECGGPVKVTHPEIVRYFMTIPEAVNLVLQAGAMAEGGEIFVLNMGEAVKILTLAENVIKFYGYEPYTEIPIQFTGLRPGEKLYEELLMNEEGLISTANEKIFIGKACAVDPKTFPDDIVRILDAANQNDTEGVRQILHEVITTYHDEVAPALK
ncbi:MAG: polysaccharide biosynthesis protein [Clostridia bacterium]|nr:polysaccharide biosynthesis protein [Clostridia bacterium]MBQ7289249.1 polysaccharide biosynthesis protein [Clostridia bacterium]